jgi:hypothetical protein
LLRHKFLIAIIILQGRQSLLVETPAIGLETWSPGYFRKRLCNPVHNGVVLLASVQSSLGEEMDIASIISLFMFVADAEVSAKVSTLHQVGGDTDWGRCRKLAFCSIRFAFGEADLLQFYHQQ